MIFADVLKIHHSLTDNFSLDMSVIVQFWVCCTVGQIQIIILTKLLCLSVESQTRLYSTKFIAMVHLPVLNVKVGEVLLQILLDQTV